jgi:hypothetical protein
MISNWKSLCSLCVVLATAAHLLVAQKVGKISKPEDEAKYNRIRGVVTAYQPGKVIAIKEQSGRVHTYKIRRRDVGPGVGKGMDVIVEEPKDSTRNKHVNIRAAYAPGSVNAPAGQTNAPAQFPRPQKK